jgi:uncharacterized glyoxalase superfamily protein PhnB
VLVRKSQDPPPSEITSKPLYLRRREFLQALRFGDGLVMLSTADMGGSAWGDQMQAISVHVSDPDELFGRATAAGAAVVVPLATTHYGARHFWARDPEGFLWGFSTYQPGRD